MDTYRFNIPIEFKFTVPGGETNPDLREKLKEECQKVVHTLLRSDPDRTLFGYPVTVDGHKMEVESWLGFLGTKHAPNRFRSQDVKGWRKVADELIRLSKTDYGGGPHTKKNIIRKATVPFYVGRWAYSTNAFLQKYEYMTFRQEELFRLWYREYKLTCDLPETIAFKPKPKPKAITKTEKAWKALSSKEETPGIVIRKPNVFGTLTNNTSASAVMVNPNILSSAVVVANVEEEEEEEEENMPF